MSEQLNPDPPPPPQARLASKPDATTASVGVRRHNAWVIVGVLIALLTLFWGVYTWIELKQNSPKHLVTLDRVSLVPLLSTQAREAGSVRVVVDDQTLDNPTWMLLAFRNSGTVPIEREDVELPLELTFDGCKVVNARVSDASPPSVQADIEVVGSQVLLRHGLLNPGNQIRLNLLLDGKPEWPKARFRARHIDAVEVTSPAISGSQAATKVAWWIPGLVVAALLLFASIAAFAALEFASYSIALAARVGLITMPERDWNRFVESFSVFSIKSAAERSFISNLTTVELSEYHLDFDKIRTGTRPSEQILSIPSNRRRSNDVELRVDAKILEEIDSAYYSAVRRAVRSSLESSLPHGMWRNNTEWLFSKLQFEVAATPQLMLLRQELLKQLREMVMRKSGSLP